MFDFGRQQAGFDSHTRGSRVQLLEERLEDMQGQRDRLRLQAAKLERAAQIDRSAVSLVQEELKSLQDERARLHKRVQFLEGLVSGDMSLLQLDQFLLSKTEDGNSFGFAFTVSKRVKDSEKVRGLVELTVSGQLQGEARELGFKSLGVDKPMKMGFSHFQKFQGELKLPVGFIPRELRVTVKPAGKKFKSFDRTFPWQVG